MMNIKRTLLACWSIENHIRVHICAMKWLSRNIPFLGKATAMILDRLLMTVYGIDLMSTSINVKALAIAHPVGVLLGGNGIVSSGRVAVMAGVKFVARSPSDPRYIARQRERRVFQLGDNVVIGANTVVVGPVDICDNVVVAAMSLVNRDITEPGIYVGTPARKISDLVNDEWVKHIS